MDVCLLLPILALGLDALLGDPAGWPHPVRVIGLMLNKLEALARAWAGREWGGDSDNHSAAGHCGNADGQGNETGSKGSQIAGADGKGGKTGRGGDYACNSCGAPGPAAEVAAEVSVFAALQAKRLRLAGLAAVLLVAGGSGACVYLLSALPGAGWLFALYFAYAGLAWHGLIQEVDRARQTLLCQGLDPGRAAVSRLVSRDVSAADEADLQRALAETLAENFNDAIIAPFFWLCLTGPAGLWVYKAVSTMDSMWGYKSEAWRDLGRAAARLDDVLAWVPARLSAFILWLTPGGAGGRGGWPGWMIVSGQARQMASPNAGWPMAVAAWLHGRAMGGPTIYAGVVVDKPRLGKADAPAWDNAALEGLLRHVRLAGLIGCLGLWLVAVCGLLLVR